MARILVTGTVTRDIVNLVDHYPAEDEKMRVMAQEIRLGGNAANTATVLAQHHHESHFLGTIATDPAGDSLVEAMQSNNVSSHLCPRLSGTTPTSYITLNSLNGSRTIVHYRNLPELSAADFPADAQANYDWFHFEGRNIAETRKIFVSLATQKGNQGISLEVETPRADIESLYQYADVLFFSRGYARAHGFDNPQAYLKSIQQQYNNSVLICSWGENGAVGMDKSGQIFSQAAWLPPQTIDTVGAGDTFNAGIIHAFNHNKSLPQALAYACEIAGRKVGQQGLNDLCNHPAQSNTHPR